MPYFLYYVANETLSRLTSSFLIIPTCHIIFMLMFLYVLLITLIGRGLVIFVTVCCVPARMYMVGIHI